MRTDEDLGRRRDDMARAIFNTVSDHRDAAFRREKNLNHKRFKDAQTDPDGTCMDDWVVILLEILETASTEARRLSVEAIAAKIIDKAQSAGNLGTKKWSASFLGRYLRFKAAAAPQDSARRVNLALAEAIARFVAEDPRSPADFRSLIDRELPVKEAIRAAVDMVPMQRVPSWKRPSDYVSSCDPSFSTDPASFDDDGLATQAQAALTYLRKSIGPRGAIIQGGRHSGKKVVLRHLVQRLEDQVLTLDNGVELPLLAMAMDDHTPHSFIDQAYRFFASGRLRKSEVDRRAATLSTTEKLERTLAIARRQPAFVVISDIAAVEEDEVVRSLAGSYASDLLLALLNGHPFTRVAFTTRLTLRMGSTAMEAPLRSDYVQSFQVSGKLGLPSVAAALGLTRDGQDLGRELDGLTARLAQIAISLPDIPSDHPETEFFSSLRIGMRQGEPALICKLIAGRRLCRDDRLLLGLICASHDGLRLSVLAKIVQRLQDDGDLTWASGLSSNLQDMMKGFEERAGNLKGLVQRRLVSVDPALIDLSTIEGHSRPSVNEVLFAVDDGWRSHFLKLWCDEDRVLARKGHWLIAREAADQARKLRISQINNVDSVSFGRDIQTLHALMASIDVTSIQTRSAPAALEDSGFPLTGAWNSEGVVLPSLDVKAARPEPMVALRYAYHHLYRRDLDQDNYALLWRKEDAAARLGILLRILSPESPWLSLDERGLSATLGHYGHVLATFASEDVMNIFLAVAISALRLQKYEIVTDAVRLGEQFFADRRGEGIRRITFMRLLRVEIDAALLLGGNPDAIQAYASHQARADISTRRLVAAADRIEHLLRDYFALSQVREDDLDALSAYGKLQGKLGEVYHHAGRFRRAKDKFAIAMEIEKQIVAKTGGAILAPVFGGRGARARMHFLFDRARAVAARGGASCFIFADGLSLPAPPLIDPKSADLNRVRQLLAINARRASDHRTVDMVGLKVDASQLAVFGHDFEHAYRQLDSIIAGRLLSGSSIETLLEVVSARTRHLLDGVVLCLQANAKAPVFNSRASVRAIATYLGMEPETAVLDVAAALLREANKSLVTLTNLLGASEWPIATFRIYRNFLSAFRDILSSRFCEPSEVAGRLAPAIAELNGVVDEMKAYDYRLYLFEAARLLSSATRTASNYTDSSSVVEKASFGVVLNFVNRS